MLSRLSCSCATTTTALQVHLARRLHVWRSSWQPAPPSPACPPDTVLPRPCFRDTLSVDRDDREQLSTVFRDRDAHHRTGAAMCVFAALNEGAERGGMQSNALSRLPPSPALPSRRQLRRMRHCMRAYLTHVPLLLGMCTRCAVAGRFGPRIEAGCQLNVEVESCELCIIVMHHIHTHGAVSCGWAGRGSRVRDRWFRYSYTIVYTPCTTFNYYTH